MRCIVPVARSSRLVALTRPPGEERRQRRAGARSSPAALACSLTGGLPNPTTFPTGVLDEIAARLIRDEPRLALQYTPSEGLPSVREYLVERQELLHGRRPPVDELIVTSGGMEAITLLRQTMLDPADTVAAEAPTYLGALMAFARYDEVEGAHGRGRLVRGRARGAPGGRPAPQVRVRHPRVPEPHRAHAAAQRRRELLELCRRHGVLVSRTSPTAS